jgi:hypothetical protein
MNIAKTEGLEPESVFIICLPRTGSTLLRFILDTHRYIACPSETQLILLIEELFRVLNIVYIDDPIYNEREKLIEIGSDIRRIINIIMGKFLKDGKKIWCDKSITTVKNIPLMKEVFPNAKYILLYRHCMDFVYSVMEVSKYGWSVLGGIRDYILRDPSNIVNSLVNFWCDNTNHMLMFEEEKAYLTHRIKYESIVFEPERTCCDLFRYIDVPFEDGLLDKIFEVPHQNGPGDPKIRFTKKIEQTSVGKGYDVPYERIEKKTLEKMNYLLKQLEYEQVESDWNLRIDQKIIKNLDDKKEKEKELTQIFTGDFSNIIDKRKEPFFSENMSCKIIIRDVYNAAWMISYKEPFFKKVDKEVKSACSVMVSFNTLLKLIRKELNIIIGLNHGLIQIEGDEKIAACLSFLFE